MLLLHIYQKCSCIVSTMYYLCTTYVLLMYYFTHSIQFLKYKQVMRTIVTFTRTVCACLWYLTQKAAMHLFWIYRHFFCDVLQSFSYLKEKWLGVPCTLSEKKTSSWHISLCEKFTTITPSFSKESCLHQRKKQHTVKREVNMRNSAPFYWNRITQ